MFSILLLTFDFPNDKSQYVFHIGKCVDIFQSFGSQIHIQYDD